MKILFMEKAPFALSLLLGLLGFQMNYLIHSITSTPAIEYTMKVCGDSIKNVTCEVTNLSRDKSFKALDFSFKYSEPKYYELRNPVTKSISPSSIHHERAKSILNELVDFKIPHIQPGYRYILSFDVKTINHPFEYPDIYLTTDETVRLLPRSIFTVIAKKQLLLNTLLSLAWIALIVVYLVYYAKTSQS